MQIELTVNGRKVILEKEPTERLLDVLRHDLALTGVKEGCGEGECGACSVLLNGRLVNSCLVPLIRAHQGMVVTIEGLQGTRELQVLQDAYADAGAVQCGFCTPGFIMASYALLKENPRPDREAIREGLSGNLCRCTGYNMIIDAVALAAERGKDLW
ncbi:MAG: (2Fe-2S)-binding protein [Spirochaetales bacterium]|nr:(2Fe-2S)-binding protein [Spirochaetales bacterium]